MKKIKLINSVEQFEEFVNSQDIEVIDIDIDIKVVDQSFFFQQGFAAVVFYRELTTKP